MSDKRVVDELVYEGAGGLGEEKDEHTRIEPSPKGAFIVRFYEYPLSLDSQQPAPFWNQQEPTAHNLQLPST